MTKATEAKWRGLIEEQERSGLTVDEFGRLRELKASTLFWWRSTLRRTRQGDGATLVPVKVLGVVSDDRSAVLELEIRGDIVLRGIGESSCVCSARGRRALPAVPDSSK